MHFTIWFHEGFTALQIRVFLTMPQKNNVLK